MKACISGSNNYYESEITPNTIPKFSDLKPNGKKINECFKINQDYIKNFVDNKENSLLYASIDFFSSAIKAYLKYSGSEKSIENDNSKNSLNVILTKESNEYPQICFEQDDLNLIDNTYMLEISHMYPGMENIDIFYPIYSGFFITKTLLKNTLGLYTHYSDVHFLKKISFYLKPLKGNPEMYFVQCDNYPNCYNKITDLQNNPTKAFKAINYGNFQFYSKKYETLTKDLSPYSPSQNLLYVYCPSDSEDFCQYQVLIYSDSEEIVLNRDEEFFVVAEKDEEFMFKLSLKKGEEAPQKIDFCFNVTTDDIYFDKLEIFNNATISYIMDETGMNCYRYAPDKRFNNLNEKDIDIIFNIKALKDVNFVLKNNLICLETSEIGEIIDIPNFSFPYQTNFLILNSDSDLFFNLYLNYKNYQGLNLTKVEIGYTILNFTYVTEISNKNVKILEGSIIETLDQATRSCVIKISKEYIKEFIKDDNETQYYLHLVIVNNGINVNDNKNINAKMFLL
jgi:ssDNA-binding Zn-finger/Zn-ribbon topoisomerase 1